MYVFMYVCMYVYVCMYGICNCLDWIVQCIVNTECCMQSCLVHDQPPTQILGTGTQPAAGM